MYSRGEVQPLGKQVLNVATQSNALHGGVAVLQPFSNTPGGFSLGISSIIGISCPDPGTDLAIKWSPSQGATTAGQATALVEPNLKRRKNMATVSEKAKQVIDDVADKAKQGTEKARDA